MYIWFRETFGGIHQKFNIFPDICVFGKALKWIWNNCHCWKKNIMDNAQKLLLAAHFGQRELVRLQL